MQYFFSSQKTHYNNHLRIFHDVILFMIANSKKDYDSALDNPEDFCNLDNDTIFDKVGHRDF